MIKNKFIQFFKITFSMIRYELIKLLCKHKSYRFIRNIHGDEINLRDGYRSEWKCYYCGKIIYKKFLHRDIVVTITKE